MCVSNNTQKNRSIMVDCRKTDRSPFVFYHEGSSGEGLLCRVRGLAYVSDIDLAFTMLLHTLRTYNTFPDEPDHQAVFCVPNQRLIDQAFRSVVNAINTLGKTDESLCGFVCKPPKPRPLKPHQIPLFYRQSAATNELLH